MFVYFLALFGGHLLYVNDFKLNKSTLWVVNFILIFVVVFFFFIDILEIINRKKNLLNSNDFNYLYANK